MTTVKSIIKALRYSWILSALIAYISTVWLLICFHNQVSFTQMYVVWRDRDMPHSYLLDIPSYIFHYGSVGFFIGILYSIGSAIKENRTSYLDSTLENNPSPWKRRICLFGPRFLLWLMNTVALGGGPVLCGFLAVDAKIDDLWTVVLGLAAINSLCLLTCLVLDFGMIDLTVALSVGLLMANKKMWVTGKNNYFAQFLIAGTPALSRQIRPFCIFVNDWANTDFGFWDYFDSVFDPKGKPKVDDPEGEKVDLEIGAVASGVRGSVSEPTLRYHNERSKSGSKKKW